MQWSLGQERDEPTTVGGKNTEFLCLLQALGLLDTYSELFRGHLHSVSHSTAPVLPGASWERWNREVYVTFQADTKPTLPRTSSGGSGRSVTVQSTFHKGAKQQSTAGPCSIPTAPLLPHHSRWKQESF